jgi:RNA recognition motif-containing protein
MLSPDTVTKLRRAAVKKLFVGNLPYSANETDIQNFFNDRGINVDSVTVMRDRFTGQARGFGFVEINDDALAVKAVEACHGQDLMGRTLVVNEARPMAPRGEGGGGGRDRGDRGDRGSRRQSY